MCNNEPITSRYPRRSQQCSTQRNLFHVVTCCYDIRGNRWWHVREWGRICTHFFPQLYWALYSLRVGQRLVLALTERRPAVNKQYRISSKQNTKIKIKHYRRFNWRWTGPCSQYRNNMVATSTSGSFSTAVRWNIFPALHGLISLISVLWNKLTRSETLCPWMPA